MIDNLINPPASRGNISEENISLMDLADDLVEIHEFAKKLELMDAPTLTPFVKERIDKLIRHAQWMKKRITAHRYSDARKKRSSAPVTERSATAAVADQAASVTVPSAAISTAAAAATS